MAKIVTVHGTFASGPPEGSKWWQRTSPFTAQLQQWVESDDGPVSIEPHIWDGSNSEAARRAAGEKLADKLNNIEANNEPYVVIGHSHGGSVISAALLGLARQKLPLSGLRQWITIGTPFIETKRQRFLFSRLGVFGKAVYLTLLTFLVLGTLALFVQAESRPLQGWLIAVVAFVGPLFLFYVILRFLEQRRTLRFNPAVLSFAKRDYAGRWLSLWHAKDEAVQSLKAVKSLDVEIFSRNFAASTLNLLAVAIVPLLCIYTLNSEVIMDAIAQKVFSIFDVVADDEIYASGGTNIFENAAILFMALIIVPASLIFPGINFANDVSQTGQLGLLAFGICVLLAGATLLTFIFNGLSRILSHGLSHVLNPLTLTQLKAVAYGSDAREDRAIDAREWPVWMQRGFPPLPPPIADPIEYTSDTAIGRAIPKFRNVVESLTAADSAEATSDVLADYLTWKELIHTSYFDDQRFAKLIAYAICQCDGFRPTEALLSDPDISIIQICYGELTRKAV